MVRNVYSRGNQPEGNPYQLEKLNFHPVFLPDAQYENFYEGYSNSTLWPLCHYFYVYTQYQHNLWDGYKEVNELFRILPEHNELLKGLLGADFIGFHTYDYVRHSSVLLNACFMLILRWKRHGLVIELLEWMRFRLLAQDEVLPFLKSVKVSDKFDFPPKKPNWRERLCYFLGITKRTEY